MFAVEEDVVAPGHEEVGGVEPEPGLFVGGLAREGAVGHEDGEEDEEGEEDGVVEGEDAEGSAGVEAGEVGIHARLARGMVRSRKRRGNLRVQEDSGDEEAGEDEEEIYAVAAEAEGFEDRALEALAWGEVVGVVVGDDGADGDAAEAVEGGEAAGEGGGP